MGVDKEGCAGSREGDVAGGGLGYVPGDGVDHGVASDVDRGIDGDVAGGGFEEEVAGGVDTFIVCVALVNGEGVAGDDADVATVGRDEVALGVVGGWSGWWRPGRRW